jgi:hypothetical protein
MMANDDPKISNSGASEIWADFARAFGTEIDDFTEIDSMSADGEFRDEYVRLPYEDLPTNQECHW